MSQADPQEIRRQLDRMAASLHLELEPFVALSNGTYHAARAVLERMGVDPESEAGTILLKPVERAGHQRMMMSQSLAVRSAALKRKNAGRRIWDGY